MTTIVSWNIIDAARKLADATVAERRCESEKATLLSELTAGLVGAPNPLATREPKTHSEASAKDAARQLDVYREKRAACFDCTHRRIIAEGEYAASKADARVS